MNHDHEARPEIFLGIVIAAILAFLIYAAVVLVYRAVVS